MALISLKRFSQPLEAEVAQGKLRAFGIETVLQHDPLPGAGSLVQGGELFVSEAQHAEALRVLEDES